MATGLWLKWLKWLLDLLDLLDKALFMRITVLHNLQRENNAKIERPHETTEIAGAMAESSQCLASRRPPDAADPLRQRLVLS